MEKMQIDIRKYSEFKCEKCGGVVFRQAFIIKRIPGIMVGEGAKEVLAEQPVFVCDKCGEIHPADREMYNIGGCDDKNGGGIVLQ